MAVFTVPTSLRALAFDAFAAPTPRKIGEALYRHLAQLAGRSLSHLPLVERVELRGGSVSRCLPAISDLDLTVFLERDLSGEEWKEWIPGARRRYLTLRALGPILGEPLILDPIAERALLRTEPFLNALVEESRVLWGNGPMARLAVPPLAHRLPLALHCYSRALGSWFLALGGKNQRFHLAFTKRSLEKALRALEKRELVGATAAQQFADFFEALTRACNDLDQVRSPSSEGRGGNLSLLWETRLLKRLPPCSPTATAFVLRGPTDARALFSGLEQALALYTQDSRFTIPPLLLPFNAGGLDWAWDEGLRSSVPQTSAVLAPHQMASLQRKLIVQAVRLPADLVSVPLSTVRGYIKALQSDVAQLAVFSPAAQALLPLTQKAEDVLALREAVLSSLIWD